MFNLKRPTFFCPVCGHELASISPDAERHLECRNCCAELVLDFKYFWLYRLLCILGAILIAYYQKLQGPIFVFGAVIYNLVLFFVGSRFLLPLFPIEIKIETPTFTRIDIEGRGRHR